LSEAEAGNYSGSVSVVVGGQEQVVPLQLEISGAEVPDKGYNEGKRLSRLDWLNATVGIDEEIIRHFSPVEISGNMIKISGRTLEIGENGLPASIHSYFDPANETFLIWMKMWRKLPVWLEKRIRRICG
jgi:hypothetical protein